METTMSLTEISNRLFEHVRDLSSDHPLKIAWRTVALAAEEVSYEEDRMNSNRHEWFERERPVMADDPGGYR